ncbi:MAG: translation factor Sua5 [Flavobacteriales bacterium]|nr:MAG: translation factor Sua5 [Flavobacteriales bacterium]
MVKGIISETVQHLGQGASIVYPTETLWALGCDATSEVAVDKLSQIKGRAPAKGYVLIVDGLEMLSQYVGHITSTIRSIASSNTPTTVVFAEHQMLPPNVLGPDHSVAIRITQSRFCKDLLREFGKPIVSTSANYSDKPPPGSFEDLDENLLSAVQYVINLDKPEPMTHEPSRIVKLSAGGHIETIRI